jgi:hypothetical protein
VIDGSACTRGTSDCSTIVVDAGQGSDSVISGFTIQGGLGSKYGGSTSYGGGLFLIESAPTIRDCIITGNQAEWGGGIYIKEADSYVIEDSIFYLNSAELGGGMVTFVSSGSIAGSSFLQNTAEVWGGGVLYSHGSNHVWFDNNVFDSNVAGLGGGMAMYGLCSPATLTNNTWIDNHEYAIYSECGSEVGSGNTFTNNSPDSVLEG